MVFGALRPCIGSLLCRLGSNSGSGPVSLRPGPYCLVMKAVIETAIGIESTRGSIIELHENQMRLQSHCVIIPWKYASLRDPGHPPD